MTRREKFSFFETPAWLADKIAAEISPDDYDQVLDLGAGAGSLQNAIRRAHPKNISSTSVEIDTAHFPTLKQSGSTVYKVDLLKYSLSPIVNKLKPQGRILALSNPPYGKMDLSKSVYKLLLRTGLILPGTRAETTRKEVVFLARVLDSLDNGTEIVFIVPLALLYSAQWKELRRTIYTNHAFGKAFILPPDVFPSTEVRTAVLFLTKDAGARNRLSVMDYSSGHMIRQSYREDDVISGLSSSCEIGKSLTLGELAISFTRGISCAKMLRQRKIPHIHSSDLRQNHKGQLFGIKNSLNTRLSGEKIATAGDILVARVGSRCLASVAMLKSGTTVISDCVISIKVPKPLRNQVFEYLSSGEVQDRLKSSASGSCAKILTYSALQNLPV